MTAALNQNRIFDKFDDRVITNPEIINILYKSNDYNRLRVRPNQRKWKFKSYNIYHHLPILFMRFGVAIGRSGWSVLMQW